MSSLNQMFVNISKYFKLENENLENESLENESSEESESCSICLESLNNNKISKYECNHYFHECCLKNWDNGCPLCRAIERNRNINSNSKNKQNILDINSMRNIKNLYGSDMMIYINKWNDRECVNNNHKFIVSNPYGVLVICEDCNTIQCFNRLH